MASIHIPSDHHEARPHPYQRPRGHLSAVPDDDAGQGYLAMAVHELRGPISILVGCGETLQAMWNRPELETKGPPLVETMVSSGRRLRRLVNDLLTTAYLEQGVISLASDPVPLLPVIRWARDGAWAATGVNVDIDCPPDLCARADADRVEQILVNLISNAAQHGEPPVTVTAGHDGEGWATVSVADHGEGISSADRALLFEPFSPLAAHSPTSTGLGLSIARNLARAMGGDLTYDDQGPGATFRLRLPLAEER